MDQQKRIYKRKNDMGIFSKFKWGSKKSNEIDSLKEEISNIIIYTNYISEQLDMSIQCSETLAKKLNIQHNYIDYMSTKIEETIVYTEYIKTKSKKEFGVFIKDFYKNNVGFKCTTSKEVISFDEYIKNHEGLLDDEDVVE